MIRSVGIMLAVEIAATMTNQRNGCRPSVSGGHTKPIRAAIAKPTRYGSKKIVRRMIVARPGRPDHSVAAPCTADCVGPMVTTSHRSLAVFVQPSGSEYPAEMQRENALFPTSGDAGYEQGSAAKVTPRWERTDRTDSRAATVGSRFEGPS